MDTYNIRCFNCILIQIAVMPFFPASVYYEVLIRNVIINQYRFVYNLDISLFVWRPPSLSELIPIIFDMELPHLNSEAYIL